MRGYIPTDREIEVAAKAIWNYVQELDDSEEIRLDPTKKDCFALAKAALEAAERVQEAQKDKEIAELKKRISRAVDIWDRHGCIYKSSDTYEYLKQAIKENK